MQSSHPSGSVVPEYPVANELLLVRQALSKDVLSPHITRHVDVLLQRGRGVDQ